MQIKNLALPVVAAKADWLPGTHWMGFTPRDGSGLAREQCRTTVHRQSAAGYVIEYVTEDFGEPNRGFEDDPDYLAQKERHGKAAGRFVALHRLRPSARALPEILGEKDFERLQDVWAEGAKRYRWTVAFPIIESYAIIDPPLAKHALSAHSMKRIFGHPSGTLRPFNDDERGMIADLRIKLQPTIHIWLAIEDEAKMAEMSQLNAALAKKIGQDIDAGALEGLSEEQKIMVRKRAALLAQRFASSRAKAGKLTCDNCGFDPQSLAAQTSVSPRSLLDVHHMNPLEEGVRYTTEADFCLVCPNCHRFMHRFAATLSDPLAKATALRPVTKVGA
jgi:5-methylcytosine-specific restriction protein A